MDFEKDKVLERVRKMLRLAAEDSGATEGERDNALRAAHATLAKYNLQMSDAAESSVTDEQRTGDPLFSRSTHPWERRVAQSIGKLFFCHYFYILRKGGGCEHYFVGKGSNVYTAQELYKYVATSINKEAQRKAREMTGNSSGTYWRSFCKGAADRIYFRCEDIRKEPQQDVKGTGTSLVLASLYESEREANLKFINDQLGLKLRSGRSREKFGDAHARREGETYGSKVSLNNQIGGSGVKSKLLT